MSSTDQPRVAMVVANDVSVDSRVRKVAGAVREAGYPLSVLGIRRPGRPEREQLGTVDVTRLQVDYTLRDARLSTAPPSASPRQRRRDQRWRRADWAAGNGANPLDTRLASDLAPHRMPDRPRSLRYLRRLAVDWRVELAEYEDLARALTPALVAASPSVIHAHDIHVLPAAVRAAELLRRRGCDVRLIYDAHEYIPGLPPYGPRTLAAMVQLEAELIHRFDRVITVSEALADRLQSEHRLERTPSVVMNTPEVGPAHGSPSVRRMCQLEADVPLLVHSGGISASRGVHTAVQSLSRLPDVHLAIVSRSDSPYLQLLRDHAVATDTAARLHVVPFVEPHEIPAYLGSASIGVNAMINGWQNHEVALPNKLFEYLHAGIPQVVSDCAAMARFVTNHGVGAVFHSEDPDGLARAVREVLHNAASYRRAASDPALRETTSWQAQRSVLDGVYRELASTLG